MHQVLFAGIDWGGHRHQLSVVDRDGRRLIDRGFYHDRKGMEGLKKQLDAFSETPIAIERSEGLLVEALLEWGHVVFPVSPRISARCRERYRVASSKDDSFDAFVLADSLRHEHARWRPLKRPSPALGELRVLVRDRNRVLETRQAVEAQLGATLETYHPAAARLFSSVDRDITLAFIRSYPTPEHAARVGEKRMDAFLKRHSYRGRVPADVLVERLHHQVLAGVTATHVELMRAANAEASVDELMTRVIRAHLILARSEGAAAGIATTTAEVTTIVGSAGTLTVPAAVVITATDLTGLAWIQLRMVLMIAALSGHDPLDPARLQEFLSLQGANTPNCRTRGRATVDGGSHPSCPAVT
jgi:hypothetical protein